MPWPGEATLAETAARHREVPAKLQPKRPASATTTPPQGSEPSVDEEPVAHLLGRRPAGHQRYRAAGFRSRRRRLHRAIFAAIEAGNVDLADQLAVEHHKLTRSRVEKVLFSTTPSLDAVALK